MIPFFVVDRPISLQIIQGVKVPNDRKIGLLAHANTSANFRRLFREYPSANVIKMCDSAIFHSNRDRTTYAELFSRYEEMGADYGVIMDVLRDPSNTLESAAEALKVYSKDQFSFELVGVAQGRNVEEFLTCYEGLVGMGYEHIAIGGLLHKHGDHAPYHSVKDEGLLKDVLSEVRSKFNPSWLFVLGCLHPSRLALFTDLRVWGDYKGWIFEYRTRDDVVEDLLTRLITRSSGGANTPTLDLAQEYLSKRQKRAALNRKLIDAKKNVKHATSSLRNVLEAHHPGSASALLPTVNHGLLTDSALRTIEKAASAFPGSEMQFGELVKLVGKARALKRRLVVLDNSARRTMALLSARLTSLRNLDECDKLSGVVLNELMRALGQTDQQFRIGQVRAFIEKELLASERN